MVKLDELEKNEISNILYSINNHERIEDDVRTIIIASKLEKDYNNRRIIQEISDQLDEDSPSLKEVENIRKIIKKELGIKVKISLIYGEMKFSKIENPDAIPKLKKSDKLMIKKELIKYLERWETASKNIEKSFFIRKISEKDKKKLLKIIKKL